MERCERCGIPSLVGREHRWEPNGVISLTSSPHNRMVFFDCSVIDRVFRGIEGIIGVPIEHIVIESRSRETRRYVERIFPPEIQGIGYRLHEFSEEERERLRSMTKAVGQNIIDIGHVYGYGDPRQGELWDGDEPYPWRVHTNTRPYSILLTSGDFLGSVEVSEGRDMWVRYKEIAKDTYRIEVFPGEHPVELKERLKRRRYHFKPGNLGFERCPECGVPLEIARNRWLPKRG